MLVLARKIGEAIYIGGSKLIVLEVRGSQVRVGIEANPEIGILRGELLDRQIDTPQPRYRPAEATR
jgi:carbon storage regulator CsrA